MTRCAKFRGSSQKVERRSEKENDYEQPSKLIVQFAGVGSRVQGGGDDQTIHAVHCSQRTQVTEHFEFGPLNAFQEEELTGEENHCCFSHDLRGIQPQLRGRNSFSRRKGGRRERKTG